jgi:serine acetyltransferase
VNPTSGRCAGYGHAKLSGAFAGVSSDILRFATFSPEYQPQLDWRTKASIFLKPAVLCLFWHRLGHCLYLKGWRRLAAFVARMNLIVHKANLPSESCIGPGCFVGHAPGVSFAGSAGKNLTLFSLAVCCPKETSFGSVEGGGPQLGDAVTIGAHAAVIGSVKVGDNVQVATNAWLPVDCPSNSLAFCGKIRCQVRAIKDVGSEK